MNKIGVFHMNQIGDFLFSLPLLYELKNNNYLVYSIIREKLMPLVKYLTFKIDGIILRKGLYRTYKNVNRENFQIAIVLSSSYWVRLIAISCRIPKRIGFQNWGITDKLKLYGPPSIENNLRLLKFMNISPQKKDYIGLIKINIDDDKKNNLLKKFNLKNGEKFIIISPGASFRRRYKCWPAASVSSFLNIIKTKCVLVGDANTPKPYFNLAASNLINLVGKTSLDELLQLINMAEVVISTDSGVMHLGVALSKKTIALFGLTEPCYLLPKAENCKIIKKPNMEQIKPEEVIKLIDKCI